MPQQLLPIIQVKGLSINNISCDGGRGGQLIANICQQGGGEGVKQKITISY